MKLIRLSLFIIGGISLTFCKFYSQLFETQSPTTRSSDEWLMLFYKDFTAQLSPEELSSGNCVARAVNFYQQVLKLEKPIRNEDWKKDAKIILMMRTPDPMGAPQPLYPNPTALRSSQSISFWVWHAFIIYEQKVWDTIDRQSPQNLSSYWKNFWNIRKIEPQDWLFYATNPEGIMVMQNTLKQNTLPSRTILQERLNKFDPLSWQEINTNPLRFSKIQ